MTEYIEREAAKKEFNLNFGGVSHAVIASGILDALPAADVAPVVHGRWEKTKVQSQSYYGLLDGWKCSCCGYSFRDKNKVQKYPEFMKFCPNCGSKNGR